MRAGELVFVDTGAWIALALTRDPLHPRASETWALLASAGTRLHTSAPIVARGHSVRAGRRATVAAGLREAVYSSHDMPDSRRLLSSDAAYAHQRLFVCRHDPFDAAEFEQQPMRQRGTDTWKTLQHVQLARSQTLRLPVISLENTIVGSAELICKKAQDSERVFRIARAEHRKPPHDGQRHHRAFERMWMDIRHARRPRPLEENDRAMRAARELRSLREQASVRK